LKFFGDVSAPSGSLQETSNDFGLTGHFGPSTLAVLMLIEKEFLIFFKNIDN